MDSETQGLWGKGKDGGPLAPSQPPNSLSGSPWPSRENPGSSFQGPVVAGPPLLHSSL